jgi:hypothetical protein
MLACILMLHADVACRFIHSFVRPTCVREINKHPTRQLYFIFKLLSPSSAVEYRNTPRHSFVKKFSYIELSISFDSSLSCDIIL